MRQLRILLAISAFIAIANLTALAGASAEPWLPIKPEDLAMKNFPGHPGAAAVQLYYSYYKNDSEKFLSVYRRIKILTEAGRKYADVEIALEPEESLKELNARTIHPDGSIVEFKDKPFEKTLIKARGTKYAARVFALPDVTVGSIIEYSYQVSLSNLINPVTEFGLQERLYTVKERFRFQPYLGALRVAGEWGGEPVKYQSICSYANQAGAAQPQRKKGGLVELELDHMPVFETEDYMPPESDYRPMVMCFYGVGEFASGSPDKFWDTWQKRTAESTEKWIGKSPSLRDAAAQIIGAENDAEKKLRRLYARAQQIRNLSFEVERTGQEIKREKLKSSNNAEEVLRRGYGTHWEIDALFVALARAAGFEASLLGVNDRQAQTFNKEIMWQGQLDGVAALVKLNGKDMVLDPGTRFCPFGTLPWRRAATTALNYTIGGGFITTPKVDDSVLRRTAHLKLSADGSAQGEIAVELNDQEALAHRIDALDKDEAGYREAFEKEIRSWLPEGAVVKLTASQGWDSTEGPLTAKFNVEIPNFASMAGTRLLFPAYVLPTPMKEVFKEELRKFPVDLSYSSTEEDEITLQLPEGFEIETAPSHRKAGLSYAGYELSSVVKDNQLVISRTFSIEGVSFNTEQYPLLRNFFGVVHQGDSSRGVLKRVGPGR